MLVKFRILDVPNGVYLPEPFDRKKWARNRIKKIVKLDHRQADEFEIEEIPPFDPTLIPTDLGQN